MSPSGLPYDVLFNIISLMKKNRSRSLVNFACVSQRMRGIIIPRFLYAHITISEENGSLEALLQIFYEGRASYSDSVRSLFIDSMISSPAKQLLVEVLPTMRSIRDLRLLDASKFTATEAIAAIGSMTHLRCLQILRCTFSTFDRATEKLPELRNLRLGGIKYSMGKMSPRWNGEVLSASRETLEQLSLRHISWDLRMGLVGVWPRLRTLDLQQAAVLGLELLNLSTSFPAVRSFGSPHNDPYTWAPLPCNIPFLSNLESFQGQLWVLEVVRPIFSVLRSLAVHYWPEEPITECGHFVPPTLQSLQLETYDKGAFVPQTFGAIAEAAPDLALLSIHCPRSLSHRRALEIAEALIAFLPRLPLAYVIFECSNVTHGPRNQTLADSKLRAPLERAASLASSLDTMKAVRLRMGSVEVRWRRDVIEEDCLYEQYLAFDFAVHSGLRVGEPVP
ncbi:hypothetical protein BOTBODRAFT_179400 [Botryobasidium botryosum FD-172 SS1]|uniref:F-box domain-containing protein n=1 Tax=Botryobasidium botryosum (strain FD-172 SS1) TaxID=930990 RepID=A0A067LZN1_BOTB1|nr:hypothetical protein BOTBODRAFT_179400 [Botryobasidium botryosum FD-172 SS1]